MKRGRETEREMHTERTRELIFKEVTSDNCGRNIVEIQRPVDGLNIQIRVDIATILLKVGYSSKIFLWQTGG